MRILYLVTTLSKGGAETQVVRIANEMKKKGNQVLYVSLIKPTSINIIGELEKYQIEYVSLGMSRGKPTIKAYINFIKITNRFKPDVVHANMVHANWLIRFSAPFIVKCLKINTIHGEEEFLSARSMIYRLTDCGADYIVCCSQTLEEQAEIKRAAKKTKLFVIYNGLDIDVYKSEKNSEYKIRNTLGIGKDEFVWITVGRLSDVKNQKYLISEFQKIIESKFKARLLILGDGELKNSLISYVNEIGLEREIIFLGYHNNVSEYLNASDAFVLSSIHEGMPLSLQEAAATGMPLVSTDVGGCKEVVIEGKNGFLCKSNEQGELAQCMKKVMKLEKDKYIKMCDFSQQYAEKKFELKKIMLQWEKLYEKKDNGYK